MDQYTLFGLVVLLLKHDIHDPLILPAFQLAIAPVQYVRAAWRGNEATDETYGAGQRTYEPAGFVDSYTVCMRVGKWKLVGTHDQQV